MFGCDISSKKHQTNDKTIDSVAIYIKQMKLNEEEKKPDLLRKAKLYNETEINDSIKNNNLSKIAYAAFNINDTILFKKTNREAYNLSTLLKDTLKIGDSHWNFGLYYSRKEKLDSAYYHYFQAHKYFKLTNNEFYSAKMLYNMAFVQSRYKDYTNAETKLFQAIRKYKSLNKNLSLHKCYKLLAIIYTESEDYESTDLYFKKASQSLQKTDDTNFYKEKLLNDIGLYKHKIERYKDAILDYKEALSNEDLKKKNVDLYYKIIDNLTYSQFLIGDTINVKTNFQKVLNVRDSLNNLSGIISSKIKLAEYYAFAKDTVKAINIAKEANELAVKVKNNGDILKSLTLLSKIEKDSTSTHLYNYVNLQEQLEKQEWKIKNEFARIRFETDDYIDRAEKLRLQKTILTISIVAVCLVFALLYFLNTQRAKTKRLMLEKEQQKANEEIYQLMLNQQTKLEEGRLKERHRISEELHDGILGSIFGTRMGLAFLDIKGTEEQLEKHEQYVNQLQDIEKEMRQVSHDLKNEMFSTSGDFVALIENLIEERSQTGNFKYKIIKHETLLWNETTNAIKINIYRVVQEVLQNIIKHAQAENVELIFNTSTEYLKLVIKDDGVGYVEGKTKKGIGLKNINSRIETINGIVNIISKPNEGTVIKLNIPK